MRKTNEPCLKTRWMKTYNCDIETLRLKSKEIGSALFYSDARSVLKFPPMVIFLKKTDDKNNLCFLAEKPYTELAEMEGEFFGRLIFYRKDCPWHTEINGVVHIGDEDKPGYVSLHFEIRDGTCYRRELKNSSLLVEATATVGKNIHAFLEHHGFPKNGKHLQRRVLG